MAKEFVENTLEHADSLGKIFGSSEADFYDKLSDAYKEAKKLRVYKNEFREKALAIEKRYVRRQARSLVRHADECLERGDYTGYVAYIALKNRQENFRQTQKSTGKTAVELGRQELGRRMFMAIPADELLKSDAAVYAMMVAIAPPLPRDYTPLFHGDKIPIKHIFNKIDGSA